MEKRSDMLWNAPLRSRRGGQGLVRYGRVIG